MHLITPCPKATWLTCSAVNVYCSTSVAANLVAVVLAAKQAYLSDMVVARKGRGEWGLAQVKRARQLQQRADHTRSVPSADALPNSAALLTLCSSNCRWSGSLEHIR